ncbi:hypothetical protein TIFTF001_038929 [Ficus carica]|uniref:Uncharacterized protein n=1 Tax=Ficus carica TaxID=3494 RepID=A0AA88E8X8_FICCA|nr:hypothetical protein TIFTF001_038929 [Ficus carica]
MVRDWGLGGELHGQGWLGIGAKAVNSMGKTWWLAMRRRASMLDLDSGPVSSPTHHWDRGAKTWVARHSGKTRQRCWRGSAHGGNDQDQGLGAGPCCHHGCRIVKVDPVTPAAGRSPTTEFFGWEGLCEICVADEVRPQNSRNGGKAFVDCCWFERD